MKNNYAFTSFTALLLLILLSLSTCEEEKQRPKPYVAPHLLRSELNLDSTYQLFKDYDIFTRQGYHQIEGDTLFYPFIAARKNENAAVDLVWYHVATERSKGLPIGEKFTRTYLKHKYVPTQKGERPSESLFDSYVSIRDSQILRFLVPLDSLARRLWQETSPGPLASDVGPAIEVIVRDTVHRVPLSCWLSDTTLVRKLKNNIDVIKILDRYITNEQVDVEDIPCEYIDFNYCGNGDLYKVLSFKRKNTLTGEITPSLIESFHSGLPTVKARYWSPFY